MGLVDGPAVGVVLVGGRGARAVDAREVGGRLARARHAVGGVFDVQHVAHRIVSAVEEAHLVCNCKGNSDAVCIDSIVIGILMCFLLLFFYFTN